MSFDKYSELDPAKLQRDIEEQHGGAFFDKYAILDDAYRAYQIETTMGIEVSNAAISNPMLLMSEVVNSGGSYIAQAVHFDQSVFIAPSVNGQNLAANTSRVLVSLWFMVPTGTIGRYPMLWQLLPDGGNLQLNQAIGYINSTDISTLLYDTVSRNQTIIDTPDGTVVENQWYHLLFYGNFNFVAGAKSVTQYLDNVATGAVTDNLGATALSFSNLLNGNMIPGSNDAMEYADFQLYTDLNLDLSVTENRRLFISDDGKPVDPAIAVAALGHPAVRFSGDAASFGTNQGTGGAFTLTGALTDATSSPSD